MSDAMRLSIPYSKEVLDFYAQLVRPPHGTKPGAVQFPGDSRRWMVVGVFWHYDPGATTTIDVRVAEMVTPESRREVVTP